uniref:Peptidase M14 domain-containing protein n=1 Tax=Peronospora matthiolae TaxID=2874970 RepID=A0AAV1TIJ3_9STRA
MEIHRAPECELTRLWELDAAAISNRSALQQQQAQQRVKWTNVDMSAISFVPGAVVVSANNDGSSFRFSLAECIAPKTLYRLSLTIQLPQTGQATVRVQLPVRTQLTMALGSAPFPAATNEVALGSSQLNTSVVAAELPCILNVADAFHDVDFVWDDEWMRWYVDDVLLLEEYMQEADGSEKSTSDEDPVLFVDLSVNGSDATMAVRQMTMSSGNSSDPFCAPSYSSASNCRVQKPFSPRLGSIRGSLSVKEVEAYIDEVAATFPLITKVEELGQSVEKRPLRALCLGACYAPQKQKVPQALFTGMHHAREPISMMNMVYTIDILTSDYRNGDLAALELLTSRQLWFILVVNPDGYARNEKSRVWEHDEVGQRKSAAPTCDNSSADAGVDLNRNYDVCFARDSKGSSNVPCGDDYNGPSAFSEPETQAVRDLVTRNTSDFSVALNYHSYGKFVNIPFACQVEGGPSELNNSVFVALAQEMARFNGFQYGQSWKESNLYTVNGETSDWMWQAHGIFAMSPEVGPAFDVESVMGFWPQRDEVPQLSAELHYPNLYISRIAGPVYALVVNDIRLGTVDNDGSIVSFISVDVRISNTGLRFAAADLVGSMFVNGTNASDAVHFELKAVPDGSGNLAEVDHTLIIPYSGGDYRQSIQESETLYLVVRDALSCHLFRVAVHFYAGARHSTFRTWAALPLPRCGTCEMFGVSANLDEANDSQYDSRVCSGVKDVALLKAIRTRNVDHAISIITTFEDSVSDFVEHVEAPKTAAPTPVPDVKFADAASAEMTAKQCASCLPSLMSSLGIVALALFVGIALLVVVILSFQRRCRRRMKPTCAKPAPEARLGRSKVQYSRVSEQCSSSPVLGQHVHFDEGTEELAVGR